jgi:hypothetical protein
MRLLIINYIQKAWSVWGGRDQPESVVGIDRNRWSASIGIGGRDQSEMVVGISRNMQRGHSGYCFDMFYA